jgi:CHAT domain-containing protein
MFRELPIREARQAQSSLGLSFLLADQAADLRALDMSAAAAQAIEEAKRGVRDLDPGTAEMARALINLTESDLIAEKSADQAVQLLAESVRLYERRGTPFARATTELRRGQLLAQMDRLSEAESAFRDGIDYTERERTSLSALSDAAALQDARWDLYAQLADLYWRRNEHEAAFDLLQRGRVPAANPGITGRAAHLSRFTRDHLTVAFGIVHSKVFVWARSSTRKQEFVAPVTAENLEKLVHRHGALLRSESDRQEFEQVSRRLFDVLMAPLRQELAGVTSITIIPDGALCELAFGALIDVETQRFLIEQVAIDVAPTLPGDRPVQTATADARKDIQILVVGNPDRSGVTEDRTPSLPHADLEASAVAALYHHSRLRSRSAATRRTVLAALSDSNAVHFAGHAIADPRRPEVSRLLLAPDDEDTLGALFAGDIDQLRLPNLELVVLAACGTAAGRLARGTGVMSLARAFLYAGAHSVVATLWPIDDKESGSLFVAFHRQWIRGLAPAEALRAAQLEALHAGHAPREWAAVVTFVG